MAPRVSIGVPIYNGASLLSQSLDCLARQSLRDFEVILSDNGSTDATPDICARFAAKDSRFRHVRHTKTLPVLENFYFARDAADAPYFLWRAYDDLSDDTYLEVLADLLDARAETVLAVPMVRRDASAGTTAREFPYPDIDSAPRLSRLHAQMFENSACWFYGMWRLSACRELTGRIHALYPDPWGADHLAILAAALGDGVRGTNATAFRQRIIHETRDYMPRPKPGFAEMRDRNARFGATCRALVAASDLAAAEKRKVEGWLPRYVRRRCHRRDRIWKAWLRQTLRH
ncbi:glycosyltransferase involved in cell wall biosynthesis [Rhodovulum bhavnagarense]|uniref:Glycosyltransferase involved in cell wall biosynthesis n=1 Tax=Rhodovulum bhavnagarense TaxID=992286 RepID=A0A4R2R9A1_9RHOB|nr:glycosyltransferase [Rhodovulum bhavnagarense]TCP59800.1 glycosyltransferase involved in cell wall biosynthesis [Rhodovulum bhavnagarense]